jgi:hypothetical protein
VAEVHREDDGRCTFDYEAWPCTWASATLAEKFAIRDAEQAARDRHATETPRSPLAEDNAARAS